jgi:methionyl-tRNA formyltransferase
LPYRSRRGRSLLEGEDRNLDQPMRLAFMGTPEFAVPSLAELIAAGHEIVAVYSQPPRPKGRGRRLTPSPVHAFAETMGLSVFTPESMKAAETIETFQSLDLDAACIVAYGQILKREVLEAPRLGCFNLHGSLLPRWRGAAPIQRAVMAGDAQTGVQIMRMSEGLDEGPILLSEVLPIRADDTAASLGERMAAVGAALWPRALAAIERGAAVETPQAGEPIYAKKITPAEARIDWTRPAAQVDAHIRGLSPFPGAWFEIVSPEGPVRIKALMSAVAAGSGAPGTVLDDALTVACGQGAVRLVRVQRAGKAAQSPEEMLRGFPIAVGTVLG